MVPSGRKERPGQLVRRRDPVYLLHTGEYFEEGDIHVGTGAHGAEHGHSGSSGAVHLKAQCDQMVDHRLDLVFGC